MVDAIETYRVKIRGTRPLIMHKFNSETTRRRTGDIPDPVEEAKKAIYRDENGKIAIPTYMIKASIRNASVDYRVPGKGKKTYKDYVRAGILFEEEYAPLIVPDGKDPEEAWEVDLRPVVVQRSRIVRARPKFKEWELEFTVHIIDPIITPDALKRFIVDAGRYKGLGDFRPDYGLFELVTFEKVENGTGKDTSDQSGEESQTNT